jgi:hypothetical protein
MAVRSTSSFNSFVTETSNVRDVSTRLLNLEPDRTPLYVLTNNSKRKVNVYSPRIEFFQDADLVMVGTSNATVANQSTASTLTVLDNTIFGINDVVSVQAVAATQIQEELVQVTALSGTQSIVVTRGRHCRVHGERHRQLENLGGVPVGSRGDPESPHADQDALHQRRSNL